MKVSASKMGMPVIIEIVDDTVKEKDIQEVLDYFEDVDKRFSTYKQDSEVSRINRGEIQESQFSPELKKILTLADQTKKETQGYFDVYQNGRLDPSGIVKGYAINEGSVFLKKRGYKNFFVSIAGDIQVNGLNSEHKKWKVGIENPFNREEIIKVLYLTNCGIATSGTYIRGVHIYNPITKKEAQDIASITVISNNIYNADRMATAAFAMGEQGIQFIESLPGYEGYMVTKEKEGIATSGFQKYAIN